MVGIVKGLPGCSDRQVDFFVPFVFFVFRNTFGVEEHKGHTKGTKEKPPKRGRLPN